MTITRRYGYGFLVGTEARYYKRELRNMFGIFKRKSGVWGPSGDREKCCPVSDFYTILAVMGGVAFVLAGGIATAVGFGVFKVYEVLSA